MTPKQVVKFNALIEREAEFDEVVGILNRKEKEIRKQLEQAYNDLDKVQNQILAQCDKFDLPRGQNTIE